jgi:hypothetical protein
MIILTFTDDEESFTIFTTRGSEARALIKEHSPTTLWPHEWPAYSQLSMGFLTIDSPPPLGLGSGA